MNKKTRILAYCNNSYKKGHKKTLVFLHFADILFNIVHNIVWFCLQYCLILYVINNIINNINWFCKTSTISNNINKIKQNITQYATKMHSIVHNIAYQDPRDENLDNRLPHHSPSSHHIHPSSHPPRRPREFPGRLGRSPGPAQASSGQLYTLQTRVNYLCTTNLNLCFCRAVAASKLEVLAPTWHMKQLEAAEHKPTETSHSSVPDHACSA